MNNKVIAILPAYNAAKTLGDLYEALPKKSLDEIILVDDCSIDDTFQLAKKLPIKSFQNPKNLGYGGNLKVCLQKALGSGATIIIEIHPDNEYSPEYIPQAIQLIDQGAWLVLGNRFAEPLKTLKGGITIPKYLGNRWLSLVDSLLLGKWLADYHQGFRVYRKEFLEKIAFDNYANNFLFSFEIICAALLAHAPIETIAVESRYQGEKRGATWKHSLTYSLETFKTVLKYWLIKLGFKENSF